MAEIWQVLSDQGARRNAVLVNVGGGVITDLGGFAASCFKRGIHCVNIPTTLLAQIDASVGGKTGFDFNGLKNEIGSFAIPDWVLIDNHFLATLPERQIMSGFAEMLKHALLADEEHLAEVMQVDFAGVAGEDFLKLIRKSVAVKAAIVQSDPREKGLRKALNFDIRWTRYRKYRYPSWTRYFPWGCCRIRHDCRIVPLRAKTWFR
ncbi:MAG: 3-dehydroquinate synthase family protein [Odoribacter splanchnicus]